MKNRKERTMENNECIQHIKQAFELKEQGYYKPSIELLYKALEIENDNIEILFSIGELYFLMNNYERSMQYLEKVLLKDSCQENALRIIVKIKQRQGNLDEALSFAQRLYENHKNSNNLLILIKILTELKLFTEIENYAGTEFFNDDVKIECANALYKSGEIEQAKIYLDACNSDDERVLLLEGQIKFDENDLEKSQEIFNRISSNTQNPEILNFLGLFALENTKFIDAIKYFSMASNIDSNNSKYFYNLGNAYFYNGWMKESQNAYSKAIYLNPDNPDYRYSLAYLYYSNKDFSKARNEVKAILGICPEHMGSLILKALLLAEDKKYIEAVKLLEDCIEKNPNDDYAKTSLSVIYKNLGNYEKAQKTLEQTMAVKTGSPVALYDLGEIYICQKDYPKAIDIAEKILKENQNYISGYILGAKASYLNKDYDQSKDYAQNALALDINCSEGYYFLALTREKTNDIEEAIECMKRAILYDLNNPKYYAKMSDFYKEQKDYKTALEYISEAESLDNSNQYKFQYSELAKLVRG